MDKKWYSLFFGLFIAFNVPAQAVKTEEQKPLPIFERIAKAVTEFKIDTSYAPDDRITRKIRELRQLRGGFNINEVIDFKLEEDRLKKEMPLQELERLSQFFKGGNGKRWLDNAAIWIYRKHFSHKELKGLVKFYKTPAGRKMADDFPIIMMQSLAAAEIIKEGYMPKKKTD